MGISDLIAAFIAEELEQAGGVLELQRSDLAQRFDCVPSQINYVMSTRFSPERGYLVEPSARAILTNLAESGAISAEVGRTILAAVSDRALQSVPQAYRGVLRADIVKQVLIHLV